MCLLIISFLHHAHNSLNPSPSICAYWLRLRSCQLGIRFGWIPGNSALSTRIQPLSCKSMAGHVRLWVRVPPWVTVTSISSLYFFLSHWLWLRLRSVRSGAHIKFDPVPLASCLPHPPCVYLSFCLTTMHITLSGLTLLFVHTVCNGQW